MAGSITVDYQWLVSSSMSKLAAIPSIHMSLARARPFSVGRTLPGRL
jgi:hypothetical protein